MNKSDKKTIFPLQFYENYDLIPIEREKDFINLYDIKDYYDEERFFPFLIIGDSSTLCSIEESSPPKVHRFTKKKNKNIKEHRDEYTALSLLPRDEFTLVQKINLPNFSSPLNDYNVFFIIDENKQNYLWIEYYISKDYYEKNYNKKQLKKWKKEGYELFTGHIKSNKVPIVNFEDIK
ncbi:MAG: hypothetical protein H6604_03880 [Flavobacteriales bacterium]|nr:hypothetical protein [Flavobacteriales bacterium]